MMMVMLLIGAVMTATRCLLVSNMWRKMRTQREKPQHLCLRCTLVLTRVDEDNGDCYAGSVDSHVILV